MIVYDAGALIAAERQRRELWTLHDSILRQGLSPVVPAAVLAQVWRGGPQHNLSRLLAGCVVMPLHEALARATGALCARSGHGDVVDASVVVLAGMLGASIVTSDGRDIRRLAEAGGADLKVHQI